MRRLTSLLVVPAVLALVTLASGCAPGSVYVGVGVAGPWVGYPGYYRPPTMIGRPPVYWDEDEDEEDDVDAAAADRSEAVQAPPVHLHGEQWEAEERSCEF
jgi:hypothetical protein